MTSNALRCLPAEPTDLVSRLVAAYPGVVSLFQSGKRFRSEDLFEVVGAAVGGTLANGDFSPRDAYDAMEYALNRALSQGLFGSVFASNRDELHALVTRLDAVLSLLPTQTRRTHEQVEYQQFSTPPTLAAALVHAAGIQPGETVMDPSAGVGALLTFARAAGGRAVANELAPRRAGLLRALGLDFVSGENAEHIDATLPKRYWPDVVTMNPPFTATAGRREGHRSNEVAARHVERAARCVPANGRVVALVGSSLHGQSPNFQAILKRLGDFELAGDIALPGEFYKAFGTSFDNRLLVLDRTDLGRSPVTGSVSTLHELVELADELRANAPRRTAAPVVVQLGLSFDLPAETGAHADTRMQGDACPVIALPTAGHSTQDAKAPPQRQPGRRSKYKAAVAAARETTITMPQGPFTPLTLTVLDDAGRAAFDGDGVFETYLPQRFTIEGAQPHPDKLVESAAMAAVLAPVPTYRPVLPPSLVSDGALSLPQLEAVVMAGHSHNQRLPSGERRGFFIGDGTGVGKGREISGIILDNWLQGRRRAVWISEKPDLLVDARRDFASVECDAQVIQPQSQFRQHEAITLGDAVLFTTYATLRQSSKESTTQQGTKVIAPSRLDQIVSWLGEDFDGVIVFDESHAGGNAVSVRGARGTSTASQQALAMVELQERLPHARIVYVSATGATEVSNLSYASRLGLWGPGTPFVNVEAFISQVAGHGISVAEIVARDMKALGVYLARSLSYADVTYSRCEQVLTPEQVAIYDRLAQAWQEVLRNVDQALEASEGASCAATKSAALAAFWGANQRFFNQVLVSLQMPAVLDQIDDDLANGKSVVLQLVNTFEAVQARAIARATTQDELDELDMTPRDVLIQYVENSFPVFEHELYTDEKGVERSRVVTDSDGDPIRSPQALAMRDALLRDLQAIQVPDSPLDIILNVYGAEQVAEVTGRSRRALRVMDSQSGDMHIKLESRSRNKAQAEAAEFMAGKRRILMFSDAGGTGFSFHAARDCQNKQQRIHYLLQAGWRANKAVQGFGRTHRTFQTCAPHYRLCTTDLPGHRRFLSSIARRLDSLGALTKGHRDTANQGLFSAKDNLESVYAADAINSLFRALYERSGNDASEDLKFDELCREMGLNLIHDGGLIASKIPSVTQFLNRLLSLTVDRQRQVFDAFITRMEVAIDRAREAGELDLGMEDIRADRIDCLNVETVYTDERSGASTQAVTLEVQYPVNYRSFPTGGRICGYWRNRRSGHVWAVVNLPPRTERGARLVQQVKLLGVCSDSIRDKNEQFRFEEIDEALARVLWDDQTASLPTQRTERVVLLTGLLLNVWDRVKGSKHIQRAHTEDGRRFLGCAIHNDDLHETLTALGATAAKIDPATLRDQIMSGQRVRLTNQWILAASKVAGEMRLEVIVPSHDQYRQVRAAEALGAFTETHQYQARAFLPVDDVSKLDRLLQAHPVTKVLALDDESVPAIA